ncbi:MAG TPA: hypothetical protein VLU91_02475 [Nitrososphaerales archaeon]|nr:hypothetical protein [Nitrososphaerales archaeon]
MGPRGRIAGFLRAHPVVCLLLLSPGIPEYLSGSSPFSALVLNPGMFLFQIIANLGLYGPGVLLVREAKVRWNKGWATVLLLGAAYGILEEGVALSTLFDPAANPVGVLGVYGHWLGVNWVWLAGILPVHMIYSISIPILLLGLVLPETNGRSFLGGRKLPVAIGILGVDVAALFALIVFGLKFWMGWPVLLGSLVAIALLAVAAGRARPDVLHARTEEPTIGPKWSAALGAAFYPSVLATEFVGRGLGVPASADFVLVVLVQAFFLLLALKVLGAERNRRNITGFTFGLILPIAAFGVISQASLPLVLVADVVMFMFFRKLWGPSASAGGVGTRREGGTLLPPVP